jgi:hypothetical protein
MKSTYLVCHAMIDAAVMARRIGKGYTGAVAAACNLMGTLRATVDFEGGTRVCDLMGPVGGRATAAGYWASTQHRPWRGTGRVPAWRVA